MIGGLLASLMFNIVLPTVWFVFLAHLVTMDPVTEFAFGMAPPAGFGIYSIVAKRRVSALSVLSLVSILMGVAFAHLSVDRFWFAVKTMWLPLVCSLALLWRKSDLVAKGLEILKEAGALLESENARGVARDTMRTVAAYLPLHFLFNSVLNFSATYFLVTANPGTQEFNDQYGHLIMKSVAIVGVPCAISLSALAIWAFRKLNRATGVRPFRLARGAARVVAQWR